MRAHFHRKIVVVLGVGVVVWLAGVAAQWGPAPAAAPAAGPAAPAIRYQFMNNLDARRQPPDARGYISVTFPAPLPAAPAVLLQCANPRYSVKVHGASPTGFLFAIYRTRELLDAPGSNPFEGPGAAKPVTEYREAENIDVVWVALAG